MARFALSGFGTVNDKDLNAGLRAEHLPHASTSMRKWFKRVSPDRDTLLAVRWMRPIAHRLSDPTIWHFNRHSVARGVALGLFVSFLLPVGQIILAAMFATVARGNLLVAAAATLFSNPITFPAIYYAAYKTGVILLGGTPLAVHPAPESVSMMTLISGASVPTLLGLLLFAIVSAALGYALVQLSWRLFLVRQWRRRHSGTTVHA
jgi:uncharacterized protein (DUF2062 family)